MGWHFRYSGKKMVGSVLAVDEKVVHMAGMRSRRGYRII